MKDKKRIYLIAGEASGDLHGSNLMKGILKHDKNVDFRFWGGDKMKAQGGVLAKHIQDLAFMGFVEVLMNLKTILKNIKNCKEDILTYKPDAIILIDYPGFNLRIAEWAHENGIKVIYYISPQVWAWKQSRVHKIKKCVDKMYVILPFEKDFYKKFGMEVEYLGHPLLDAIEEFKSNLNSLKQVINDNNLSDKSIIAVLPGSRKQEISVKLPIMLEAAKHFPDHQIVVAGAPNLESSYYDNFIGKEVKLVHDQTYDLLSLAEAAIVTSGTATLETALFEVPQVVCYKGSSISYVIAKNLIKIKYISLVNLIMDKEVVKELIQNDCTSENIASELKKVIVGGEKRDEMLKNYSKLKNLLGNSGASEKVAQSLLKTIES